MSDPIGTVRRESHHDGGSSIWVRQDPGYPDDQFSNTEWTCIHSTHPGFIGERRGRVEIQTDEIPVIGQVPGTPAITGEDVEVGALVRVDHANMSDEVKRGAVATVTKIYRDDQRPQDKPTFRVEAKDGTEGFFWRHEFTLLPDGECPYTHSHTRQWCGYAGCRES